MVKRWLLKLYLLTAGIRFYQTDTIPKTPEFRKVVFETIEDKEVQFFFYKDDFEHYIFRAGSIRKIKTVGYLIQAKFHDKAPSCLTVYNNIRFLFIANSYILNDEKLICETLLSIYLDLLKKRLKT